MSSKPRIGLAEFIERAPEHKLISRHFYNVEDTQVLIKVLTIPGTEGSEHLKFEFTENAIYYPIEKIYCNIQQELMVLAPPFLYTDSSSDGKCNFKISCAYDVCCDVCGSKINYINTNTKHYYCDECFMNDNLGDDVVDDTNIIVVLAGTLAE